MCACIHLKPAALALALTLAWAAPVRAEETGVLGRGFILPPAMAFGLAFDRLAPPTSAQQQVQLQQFSLAPDARHAGVWRELGGVRIKFGVLATGFNHGMAARAFDPDALSPALMTVQPRIDARVLEFSHSFDHAALSFSLMRSKEGNPWPGVWRSVTAFGLGAPTSSAQLTGVWLIAPKTALAAQASYGRTPLGRTSADGIVRSNALSLGLVMADRYRAGDRLSFAVSRPIRAYAWTSAMPGMGNGERSSWQAAEPSGRELLAEMNYVTPVGTSAYAGWAVSLRRHPNNEASAPLEKLAAVRYVHRF
ncbi:hypothetical protein EDC30_104251 [Paucimonas lemoignei]|uniref:Uncharacterized protein n=1 Tax=Paucimonas lemoignei TaxID=29443 RepID=A0A4R3HWF5_PAULE|nr:hypothetical protein [Paucimonas lemoignei]TCS37448.1 hypothetical protein EDC30_104251 [Paucimonas lemoignei]